MLPLEVDQSSQTAPSQDRQDIAQIVRETINALDGKKSVTDGYANKQREEIVRALPIAKDGLLATMEQPHVSA